MKRKVRFFGLLFCTIVFSIPLTHAADYRFVKSKSLIPQELSSWHSTFQLSKHYQFKKVEGAQLVINNIKYQRFREFYRGLPVWNTVISATVDGQQGLRFAKGFIVGGIEQDITNIKPRLSAKAIYAIAIKAAHLEGKKINQQKATPYIRQNAIGLAELVYHVDLLSLKRKPTRPNFLINANTGQVIQQWDALNTEALATGPGGNTRIGRYHYGTERASLEVIVDNNSGLCQFKTANFDSRTYGGGKAHEFTCFDNTYKETNGAYSPINDMHFFASQFYDMFQSWYQRKPVNGVITHFAHDGLVTANAYWTGSSTNYGDGNDSFFPFTTDDIVAHEIAHGTTEQSSGLVYIHQSGGLNESFSDITGAAFKFYMGYPNYWFIGSDVRKLGMTGIRSFIRPGTKGQIDNVELYNDDLDVHVTSGPFNHAFYILSTRPGWDLRKAYDIFVLANTQLWTEETNFDQAALGLYEAAEALTYGTNDLCFALKNVGQDCGRWPEPGSEPYQLINGETYADLHGEVGTVRYFKIEVPFQANNLKVSIFNGEGDADLYVAYERQPSAEDYDCKPNVSGNNETCFFKHVEAGTYYIAVKAHKAYSQLKMKARYVTEKCLKHININNLRGDKGSRKYFVYCPERSPSLVSTHGGTGDVDLYIKKGAKPTLHDFDCRPYELGNDEECRVEENASYYIMLHGHKAYADVTLSSHE